MTELFVAVLAALLVRDGVLIAARYSRLNRYRRQDVHRYLRRGELRWAMQVVRRES